MVMEALPKIYNSNIYPLQRGHIDRITKVKRLSENKFLIKTFNDYVTVKKITVKVFPSGKFIARKTVDTNYRPVQKIVCYYDCNGKKIVMETGRQEKIYFDKLP